MSYALSQIDRKNVKWFANDETRASLKTFEILKGEIRGLRRMRMEFDYPITAIAGRNGCGKTTVLAMAACGFHGQNGTYVPRGRKKPYYTFSDFFIQTKDEVPLEGIAARYGILHNKWKKSERLPKGRGFGYQIRKKKRGGRWNNYDRRVNRPVVYLGIERLVPHSERSVSRSYRNRFESTEGSEEWAPVACKIASRILSRTYSELEYIEHYKYRLPIVSRGSLKYSGFNMGAGEDALFELLSYALDCPMGALILVDEIELGLHPEAQIRLIEELKSVVCDRKLQIICTTHSPWILESLPPNGRFFIDRLDKDAVCLPGISADYAMGKLLGKKRSELDLFVEDDVGASILEGCLSREKRRRVRILPIGSAVSISRNLAARFIDDRKRKVVAFFDGDQRPKKTQLQKKFLDALELSTRRAAGEEWIEDRLHFLPGDVWPELELMSLQEADEVGELADEFDVEENELKQLLEEAANQGKHREVKFLEEQLDLERAIVLRNLTRAYFAENPDYKVSINQTLSNTTATFQF